MQLCVTEMDEKTLRAALSQLDVLLSKKDEVQNMGNFLLRLGCYYDPTSTDMAVEEWLALLKRFLTAGVNTRFSCG